MIQIGKKNLSLIKIKKVFRNILIVTIPALLGLFLVLELFFRFIIPASDPPQAFFDEKELMYRFDTSEEDGLCTFGKFAQQKAHWRINNFGWNSPIDYVSKNKRKRIAIIGDSYIEAFQVGCDKSYPSLLRNKIGNVFDVYSFGKSGAPLSQYLHISRYVNKYFNPDVFIFNVVQNDFAESILGLRSSRTYFLTLNVNNNSIEENKPVPNYSFSQYHFKKRLLKKSALFRYICFNLKIKQTIQSMNMKYKKKRNRFNANIDVYIVKKNRKKVLLATRYILNRIKVENPNKRIIFLIDAPRQDIYNNNIDSSSVIFLNKMLKKLCLEYNFKCLDLAEPMRRDY